MVFGRLSKGSSLLLLTGVGKSVGVEKCTMDFNTHLADRCIMYKRLLMLSWCEYLIIASSSAIQILIGIALLTTSLLKYKHYYVVMLSFSGVLAWCGIVGYFIISWMSFYRLARTATFPYPTVSFAFFVNLLACMIISWAVAHSVMLIRSIRPSDEKKRGRHGLLDYYDGGGH
ncbi:hypothetical protein Pmar_PMAR012908 [Perkinsus marinus ATCC 50983]|uniref:Uncharacterized protein n=1 Tax=Perkinsus marinus (strain ATCC 50983 / TXsc) TaxID=423536 RepID=C5LWI2_PERM5|nr:hypothetical protein Pmar_PMAR012908 [Perkinsus marinus ATCC 50983]EEQ98895.1 hypothetical protein Pmar_PMAR012908 [Perkinsus marinus ATCC 50983]|eukprot:XP_002766178.1 hypothetical protein Pmar_PMAR012908 [Perkinsus marinus ATCC 50983]